MISGYRTAMIPKATDTALAGKSKKQRTHNVNIECRDYNRVCNVQLGLFSHFSKVERAHFVLLVVFCGMKQTERLSNSPLVKS